MTSTLVMFSIQQSRYKGIIGNISHILDTRDSNMNIIRQRMHKGVVCNISLILDIREEIDGVLNI